MRGISSALVRSLVYQVYSARSLLFGSTVVLGGGGSVALVHLGCIHQMLVWDGG